MNDTSLKFTVYDLKEFKKQIDTASEHVGEVVASVKGDLKELPFFVSGINKTVGTFSDTLDSIKTKMDDSFDQMSRFLESQAESYDVVYATACEKLNKLLDYINSNYLDYINSNYL